MFAAKQHHACWKTKICLNIYQMKLLHLITIREFRCALFSTRIPDKANLTLISFLDGNRKHFDHDSWEQKANKQTCRVFLQAADCCFIYFFSSTESFYDSSDNNWQTSRKLKWNEDGRTLREDVRQCCETAVCFSVLRPNLFFTINQHAVVAKQSSDPQHIHKRGKVKQRAHLSLPLIIQDIISKKWKLSKMWGEEFNLHTLFHFNKKWLIGSTC